MLYFACALILCYFCCFPPSCLLDTVPISQFFKLKGKETIVVDTPFPSERESKESVDDHGDNMPQHSNDPSNLMVKNLTSIPSLEAALPAPKSPMSLDLGGTRLKDRL